MTNVFLLRTDLNLAAFPKLKSCLDVEVLMGELDICAVVEIITDISSY